MSRYRHLADGSTTIPKILHLLISRPEQVK